MAMVRFYLSIFFLLFFSALQSQAMLNGNVVDENNQPITNATLRLEGIAEAKTTDEKGNFSFKNLKVKNYQLEVFSKEFESKTININKNNFNKFLSIQLKSNEFILDEIVITGFNKRTQKLQNTAGSVTALTSKFLENHKVESTTDLLFSTPNLMVNNAGSPVLNMISIRGIATASESPLVGVYIDGIPSFSGYSASMQLQDIRRVEVLRGPQGTLYGQNSIGGVINIITKEPQNQSKGFAKIGLGNLNQSEYRLGASIPIIKEKLYASFNGYFVGRKGLYTNEYTQKDFDDYDNFGGNFYLKLKSHSPFSLIFNSKLEQNNLIGTNPYQYINEQTYKEPFHVNMNLSNKQNRTLWNNSLLLKYEFSNLEISALTGISYLNDTYEDYDQESSPLDLISWNAPLRKEVAITEEIKFTSKNIDKWEITAGLFGFNLKGDAESITGYGVDAVSMDPNAPYDYVSLTDTRKSGFSIFGQATYEITPKLKITTGLRYDYAYQELDIADSVEKLGNPTQEFPERHLETSDNAISPRVNIAYRIKENLMVYGNYAKGFRSGGVNQYGLVDGDFLTYDPEYTHNYEIGLKSHSNNKKLRANFALFYTKWYDQQQTLIFPDYRILNTGEMYSKGVEVELNAVVLKYFKLYYNIGVVDTEFQKLELLNETGTANFDAKGNQQINTPAFNSALGLTYTKIFNKDIKLMISPEWKLVGKQYLNYYNDLKQDPFNLLNLNIGLNIHNFKFNVWGKNILDKNYLSFVYGNTRASATSGVFGLPRTYGATLGYYF